MKSVILQNDLNKWVSVVSRVIPTRGQLPVLANFLIEAEKDGLVISATNLELGLRVNAGGKCEETGAITVPAKNLTEYINSLPSGNVNLESDGDKLKVIGGKSSATFTGIPASEFPVISKLDTNDTKNKIIKIKKKILENISSQIAYCAATDESRPVLTGVKFDIDGEELKITATDGFRLSRKVIKVGGEISGLQKGIILPAKTILEMARIVQDGRKEEIEMGLIEESNQVVINYDAVQLSSRILEGNFPDVEKTIPKEWKTEILVDREELLRAIRAVGIFARDSANIARLRMEDNILKVEASSSQTGESVVEIEVEKKGEDNLIAFNYRYMLDFLNSVSGERIVFRMTDSLAPGVFGMETDEDLVHLIMPVRV